MNTARAYERQRYVTDKNGIKVPVSTDWVRLGTCPIHEHETREKGKMRAKISRTYEGVNEAGWIFFCDGIVKQLDRGDLIDSYQGAHRFVNTEDPAPRNLPQGVHLKRYVETSMTL